MLRFWKDYPQIELSRSCPYHKNDNRFVEQKNSSLVRAYVGDIQLETVAQSLALDKIYQQLWLFNNCFQPCLCLSAKNFITPEDGQPARIHRSYSTLTPWQRLCHAGVLAPDLFDLLRLRIDVTNLRVLQRQIHADLDALYLLPCKSSDVPEDVFDTLNVS
jgi:hypothetical protein